MSADSSIRPGWAKVLGSSVVPEMVPPTSTMCAENGTGAMPTPIYQYSPDQRPVRSLSRENRADFSGKAMTCWAACLYSPGRTNAGSGIIQGQPHSSNSHENPDC